MSTLSDRFQYAPRAVDGQTGRCLGFMPTVLLEGPRGCGKTTTARRFAASELLLDDDSAAREHAEHGTLPLHGGPFPMLIDEWQLAPAVWNRVRRASDERVYAQASRASVLHYSDSNNLEADAIVQSRDGSWIAAEIKLGSPGSVDTAAAALLRLRRLVDARRSGRPAKLLVITATGYAYERSDGVAVAPITLLGP